MSILFVLLIYIVSFILERWIFCMVRFYKPINLKYVGLSMMSEMKLSIETPFISTEMVWLLKLAKFKFNSYNSH